MILSIIMNLIAIIVVVGGWAVALWAAYRSIPDPGLPSVRRPLSGAAPVAVPDGRREPALADRRAA